MPAQNVKAIVKRYFTEFPEDNSKWKCRCGKILTQKPNTGWSILFQHIKSQHSDYLQDAQSTLQSFVVSKPASTKKAANIYSWLEWICCGLKPFNFFFQQRTFFQHCRYHVFWYPTTSTATKLGNATLPQDKQKVLDTWCSGKVRKFSWYLNISLCWLFVFNVEIIAINCN